MPKFIVIKRGIYIQAFWGPFGEEEAKRTAERLKKEEPDDYHEFSVYSYDPVEGFSNQSDNTEILCLPGDC